MHLLVEVVLLAQVVVCLFLYLPCATLVHFSCLEHWVLALLGWRALPERVLSHSICLQTKSISKIIGAVSALLEGLSVHNQVTTDHLVVTSRRSHLHGQRLRIESTIGNLDSLLYQRLLEQAITSLVDTDRRRMTIECGCLQLTLKQFILTE